MGRRRHGCRSVAAISTGDAAAREAAIVGDKAARLAQAAAAGMPVLPGRVLPLPACERSLAAGVAALERSGPSAAYLAATAATLDPDVEAEVASLARAWHATAVVRSSTVLDGDGRWSGAFSSYVDVQVPDVPAAVRGCWASVFSRDAQARKRETGTDADRLRVAVLVQPFVRFDLGGTARAELDGSVVVSAGPAGPSVVVGGGPSGIEASFGADGRCSASSNAGRAKVALAAAAAMARRAAEATGIGVIEWGARGDEVVLLQVGPAAPPSSSPPCPTRSWGRREVPAGAERLALIVAKFPGPLGEELVVPWAIAPGEIPEVRPILERDPTLALAEARQLARVLAAAAWDLPPMLALEAAASVSRLLREGRILAGLQAVQGLRPPDPGAAGRLLGLVTGVGATLVTRGMLPSTAAVWRLSAHELDHALNGRRPALRRGADRWQPFLAEVVAARGRGATGTPAARGVGVGRMRLTSGLRPTGHSGHRDVLAAALPLPQLSPLLWHCAGVVTAGGSPGAHLFEVARSLGVAAVTGVDVTDLGERDALVAVDGDSGRVSVLPSEAGSAGASRRRRRGTR